MLDKLRRNIITENDIQNAEAIEFSFTGELIPFEVVEEEFNSFIKELKETLSWGKNHGNGDMLSLKNALYSIDKLVNSQSTEDKK